MRTGTLDTGVSAQRRTELRRAYLQWMPLLTTRADMTLKYRAKVAAPETPQGRVWLVLSDDLLRATVVRFLNRLNGRVLRPPRNAAHRPRLDALVAEFR